MNDRDGEIQRLQEALIYWEVEGTDQEARESGMNTSLQMAESYRKELMAMGLSHKESTHCYYCFEFGHDCGEDSSS